MARQFELPGFDPTPEPSTPLTTRPRIEAPPLALSRSKGLFFAVIPNAEAAGRLVALGARLHQECGSRGRLLEAKRLHITLHWIGAFADAPPQELVDAARRAASTIELPPIEVVFDRALTFSPRASRKPFVLRCGDGSPALSQLRQQLGEAMADIGFRPAPAFTPHMTLWYDREERAERAIEPVVWPAHELVLFCSHAGEHVYEALDRNRLGAVPPPINES
jgi:2'-5' RNA ligase